MKDKAYREQLEIQRHAAHQRAKIREYINNPGYRVVTLLAEAEEKLATGTEVLAVIDPQIVQMLRYEPIRRVARFKSVSDERKKWLAEYWLDKYEIEITGKNSGFDTWDHEVGLVFTISWPRRFSDRVIYDYPACVISGYLIKK